MENSKKKLYIFFRDIILIVTFLLALNLEKPSTERFIWMLIIFILFFVFNHIRDFMLQGFQKVLPYTFIIDILLLLMLEYNSQYVENYYFNVYYFFLLISAGQYIKSKARIAVCIIITLASMYKITIMFETFSTMYIISYSFFTVMVFITLTVFFNYSRILAVRKEELDILNKNLQKVNDDLHEKNIKIKELTVFEERNRIARDIHDSVGHQLTGLLMNLEYLNLKESMDDEIKEKLVLCNELAKTSLEEIRKSVKALKPETAHGGLKSSLLKLKKESETGFNLKIRLDVDKSYEKTKPDFNFAVYRTCQEAITNAVKHGQATEIQISISSDKEMFRIFVKDNGKGTEKFTKGNGLTGIIERLSVFNGDVSFFSKDGFMINIKVPLEGVMD
jgi:signal transduction histidine kinase